MRKIIHIDMDAFFASVEQRDNSELKGKPVVVGGDPKRRGVVAACSYEARKFGIHSAMPASHAINLCKDLVIVYPRFHIYRQVSQQIHEIFCQFTDLIEPLSLDEAYLDVTVNKKNIAIATDIANEIRKLIFEKTGLTASAGVSFNKFLAKVASDFNKPNGITIITPNRAPQFINDLPIGKFFGIGKVTEAKMIKKGVKTGADLKKISLPRLLRLYGKAGQYFYDIAHGNDNRPVRSNQIRKSVGKETTFVKDVKLTLTINNTIKKLIHTVVTSLGNKKGRTITLKIRYDDFSLITRRDTLEYVTNDETKIFEICSALLKRTDVGKRYVRLVGVSLSTFDDKTKSLNIYQQLSLDL